MLRGKGPALTWLPLPQPSFSAKGRLLGEAFLDSQQVTPSTTWDPTALSSRTSPLAVSGPLEKVEDGSFSWSWMCSAVARQGQVFCLLLGSRCSLEFLAFHSVQPKTC